MPTAWGDAVRRGKKLAVFATQSAKDSYEKAITQAIEWFNAQKVGVTLSPVETEAACHIRIDAKDGSVTGGRQSDWVKPEIVDGQFFREDAKAWIFVPVSPKISYQVPQGPGRDTLLLRREAGDPIKMFMIAHELLHCAGLDQEDHTSPKHGDVFTGEGNWVPEAGASPASDKMNLSGQVGHPLRQPPLTLHPSTRMKLVGVWV
jgi:hypothetical protein